VTSRIRCCDVDHAIGVRGDRVVNLVLLQDDVVARAAERLERDVVNAATADHHLACSDGLNSAAPGVDDFEAVDDRVASADSDQSVVVPELHGRAVEHDALLFHGANRDRTAGATVWVQHLRGGERISSAVDQHRVPGDCTANGGRKRGVGKRGRAVGVAVVAGRGWVLQLWEHADALADRSKLRSREGFRSVPCCSARAPAPHCSCERLPGRGLCHVA
jgi:hypothetical protein